SGYSFIVRATSTSVRLRLVRAASNRQWLQPIETWELSRISSLYVLLPPVYDYVFQLRRFVEEFSEQTFDEISVPLSVRINLTVLLRPTCICLRKLVTNSGVSSFDLKNFTYVNLE
ncbi:hypothetical protein Tco_0258610, partial [Tanacetum coccineum]